MDYEQFYDFVVRESARLKAMDVANDYQLCKALAACYERGNTLPTGLQSLWTEGNLTMNRRRLP